VDELNDDDDDEYGHKLGGTFYGSRCLIGLFSCTVHTCTLTPLLIPYQTCFLRYLSTKLY